MRVRQAAVALVAAALGIWVAVAAAAGGFGAGSSYTNGCEPPGATVPDCPKHPSGFGGAGGGAHHHGSGAGAGERHHRGASGSGSEGPGGLEAHGPGRPTNFTFSVRLGHGLGTGSNAVHGYSAHVLPPHGSPSSCDPPVTRRANIASRSQVARIHLKPPAAGWCDGHYRVTVTLNP